MSTTHTHPITEQGWIRWWLDHWHDGDTQPHWREGWEGYICVRELPEVDPNWGPWMVEWDPRPGYLILDNGEPEYSAEWL